MKFKLKEGERNLAAYGYEFKPNRELDVSEANLIKKFQKYHQLEATTADEKQEPLVTDEVSEKAALQAECEAQGIEYDKRWGVSKLQEAVNGN